MGPLSRRVTLLIMILAVALPATVSAQSGPSGAELTGLVRVGGQEPVADAEVLLRAIDSGKERTGRTDALGRYRFEGLAAGSYLVLVTAEGMSDVVVQVTVPEAGTRELDVAIRLRGLTEQVTVSATKTERDVFLVPDEVSVVGRQQLDAMQARSLNDVLRYLPNVEMGGTRRQVQAPTIRGLNDRRVLVLRDGARISQFDSAHKGDFFLEPNDVEQIEVIRGPASALYGSGALGGVVSITSRDPGDLLQPGQRMGGTVTANFSNAYDEGMLNPRIFGGDGNGFGWALGYTGRRNDGSVDIGGSEEPLRRAEENVNAFNARTTIPVGERSRFRVSLDAYRNSGATLSNLSLTTISPQYEVDRRTAQYTGTLAFQSEGDRWFNAGVGINLWYNDIDIDESFDDSDREEGVGYQTYGIDARNSVDVGEQTITYGVEAFHDRQRADRNGEANVFFPDGDQSQVGLYLQDEIRLFDGRLNLVPGARWDHWSSSSVDPEIGDSSSSRFNPKLGAVFQPVEGVALTANYARGFRAPMLNEMFLDGVHFAFPFSPGITVLGIFRPNPLLDPESSESIDFGARYRNRRFDARVNYYYTKVDDFIDTIFNDQVLVLPAGLFLWYFDTLNVDSATLQGWEASASWMPVDALLLRGAYAAPRGENDVTGATLGSIPPDKLVLGIEGRPFDGVTLGLNGRFYAEDLGEEEVREPQDAFRLFDFYASWQPDFFEDVTLFFNVDNLGDTAYDVPPFGMPGTGRDIRLGLSWSLGR